MPPRRSSTKDDLRRIVKLATRMFLMYALVDFIKGFIEGFKEGAGL